MIAGVVVDIDREAVVVRADNPFSVLSSAVMGGGAGAARTIVNVHVPKSFRCQDSELVLADFIRRRGLSPPVVGLLTGAWTENAEVAEEAAAHIRALAVVTVGLSNPVGAGRAEAAIWSPSTINTIVVVDAAPTPAALVNLVMTATEVKALALAGAGLRAGDGGPASGTSTDAVVVAATGRGQRCPFGGPASDLGALVARTVRTALEAGVRRWMAERP
jgi:iron complex transport system ATP-binding protein